MNGKGMHTLAFFLVVIGGINWLLVGLFSWDIGVMLFGGMSATISRVLYVIIGLSAFYLLASHKKDCKVCSGMK